MKSLYINNEFDYNVSYVLWRSCVTHCMYQCLSIAVVTIAVLLTAAQQSCQSIYAVNVPPSPAGTRKLVKLRGQYTIVCLSGPAVLPYICGGTDYVVFCSGVRFGGWGWAVRHAPPWVVVLVGMRRPSLPPSLGSPAPLYCMCCYRVQYLISWATGSVHG